MPYMSTVSYARRGLERRSLSVDEIILPSESNNNCAVFGGNENERIAVMIKVIRRNINNRGIIILHDAPAFERSIIQTYHPVTTIEIGRHSFDPLIGVDRVDAGEVRAALQRTVASKGITIIRIPTNDQALHRMIASELTGLTYSALPFLLVLFEIRQAEREPFISLAIGDHSGVYNSAIAGSTIGRSVSYENIPALLQSYNEVLFLPTEDLQEAQHISNCFGSYIRTYSQPAIHQHGRWPFKHNGSSISLQQIQTNNINPQSLKTRSLICGTSFKEPILIRQIVL